jgi:hypothetical protein
LVLNRKFWRHVAEKGARSLSAQLLAECRQRTEFVLGQVELSKVTAGRWLEIPWLQPEQRAKLEAVRVGQLSERLQALQEAFAQGQFDFVGKLLACSYSRYGRRAHHPQLMIKVWLAMLAVGCLQAASFLRAVDDSVQLRLFLEVMSQGQLPSARRIKGFAAERLAPVMEYLVLWHQFLLLREVGIEIGSDFGTDSADMHAQARMKLDAAAKHLTPLLSWLIGECRRFCQATGRDGLNDADRDVLLRAFVGLDWKALGNFGRNRQVLLQAIGDTFKGGLVTPGPSPVNLDRRPRDGPVPTDVAEFAKALAAEFFARMKVFGEKFDSSVFYDPEAASYQAGQDHPRLWGAVSGRSEIRADLGLRRVPGRRWLSSADCRLGAADEADLWLGNDPVDFGPRVHDRQGDPPVARRTSFPLRSPGGH